MIEDYYKAIQVYRLNEAVNAFGAVSKTWTLLGTVQGLINAVGPKEQEVIASQYQVDNAYNFYCELSDVRQGDKLRLDGIYYRVITNPKNTVHRDHHLKFILERLDADV